MLPTHEAPMRSTWCRGNSAARAADIVPQIAGNLAMQQLFRSDAIQTELAINQPCDIYEQEADRVAAAVVSGRINCAAIVRYGGFLQTKTDPSHVSSAPHAPAAIRRLASLMLVRPVSSPRLSGEFTGRNRHVAPMKHGHVGPISAPTTRVM